MKIFFLKDFAYLVKKFVTSSLFLEEIHTSHLVVLELGSLEITFKTECKDLCSNVTPMPND